MNDQPEAKIQSISLEEYHAHLENEEEWESGPLKDVLLEYVGQSKDSEEITVEMIVETMADEFPEFLMAVAEENWIRGYRQAIHDIDQGQRMLAEQAAESGETAEADV
tara:strand:- start:2548 stop:2871 length:324 start_codon:yes stop_codon:yes gene_type:complete